MHHQDARQVRGVDSLDDVLIAAGMDLWGIDVISSTELPPGSLTELIRLVLSAAPGEPVAREIWNHATGFVAQLRDEVLMALAELSVAAHAALVDRWTAAVPAIDVPLASAELSRLSALARVAAQRHVHLYMWAVPA